jgi:plastocyanin
VRALVVAHVGCASCADPAFVSDDGAVPHTVTIAGMLFQPESLTVAPGDLVV